MSRGKRREPPVLPMGEAFAAEVRRRAVAAADVAGTPADATITGLIRKARDKGEGESAREAARGLLHLVADRAASGKPLDVAITAWLGAAAVDWLTGRTATLDDALNLLRPAHREPTARDKARSRAVCALVADLLLEWERRPVRGGLRHLSVRQVADVLATLSKAREPRQTVKAASDRLRTILADCPPARQRELTAYLLAKRAHVPRGLTAAAVRATWRDHRAEYAPDV